MKGAALLGLLQMLNFLVYAMNMRAIAHARYVWIAVTDFMICALNFTIIKKVADASTLEEFAFYAGGGVVGAMTGVWLSRHWRSE